MFAHAFVNLMTFLLQNKLHNYCNEGSNQDKEI
jgi:hypothetical protein